MNWAEKRRFNAETKRIEAEAYRIRLAAKRSTGWTTAELVWWLIGTGAYVTVACFAIIFGPNFLVSETATASGTQSSLSAKDWQTAAASVRQSILLAAGGGLALITLIVTVSRDAIARGRAAQQRAETISAQFTEAVGQLASEGDQSVRVGGIYALERIAQDSSQHRIGALAVLAHYIRERGEAPDNIDDDRSVAPDVQTAAEVITRLTASLASPRPLSLDGVNLFGLDLRGADFSSWSLNGFEAWQANLSGAKLRNVLPGNFNLSEADLTGADLAGSSFYHGTFTNARLWDIVADGVEFKGAHMQKAEFIDADLIAAVFNEATLHDADFTRAKLHRADFTDAKLRRVEFAGAELAGATFDGADLTGAKLAKAKGLTTAQALKAKHWDRTTTWPSQFHLPPTKL